MSDECIFAIESKNFVMIAADQTIIKNGVVMKNDADKMHKLTSHVMMAVIGEQGDTDQFAKLIQSETSFYKIRNSYELGPSAVAHYTRWSLANYIRQLKAYDVNILMGGFDEDGSQLYYMDSLAVSMRVPYATHGFGGLFAMSILQENHKTNATEQEAYEVMKLCVKEIHKRYTSNLPNFQVSLVDKHGIRALPVIRKAFPA